LNFASRSHIAVARPAAFAIAAAGVRGSVHPRSAAACGARAPAA
jgi:hypothetical protein